MALKQVRYLEDVGFMKTILPLNPITIIITVMFKNMKIRENEIYHRQLTSSSGWIRKVGFLFLVLLLLSACGQTEDPTPDDMGNPSLMDGDSGDPVAAPDFDLASLAGPRVKLSDHEGKVVVLFFFGFNCSLCISAAPTIQERISSAYASNPNFVMFGLDQWNGNPAGVQAFQNTTSVTFPLLLNGSGAARDFSTTYDRLIVVDQDGNIAFRSNTNAVNSINDVVAVVDSLLK